MHSEGAGLAQLRLDSTEKVDRRLDMSGGRHVLKSNRIKVRDGSHFLGRLSCGE
jgi:hypothetical protein